MAAAIAAAAMNGARVPKPGEQAADRRAEDEAEAEGGAHQPEGRAALLGCGHVGEDGIGRDVDRAGDPGDETADEQPADGRRRGHERIIGREGEHGKEQDGPPAETVAEIAEHRPGEELRTRISDEHIARDPRRLGEVDMAEMDDEAGQDRQHDAEADRVDQHRRQHDRHRAVVETHQSGTLPTAFSQRSTTG